MPNFEELELHSSLKREVPKLHYFQIFYLLPKLLDVEQRQIYVVHQLQQVANHYKQHLPKTMHEFQ